MSKPKIKIWEKDEYLRHLTQTQQMAEVVAAYRHPESAIRKQQERPDRRVLVFDGSDKGYLVLVPWKAADGPPKQEDL